MSIAVIRHRSFAPIVLLATLLAGATPTSMAAQGPRLTANSIVLPYSAAVQITVNNAITNSCDGNFGLELPEQELIFANYNSRRGETYVLGPYAANTELVFYIQPLSFCSGYRYLSTNTAHARVTVIAEGIWRIDWEDLPDHWPPDNDFDDLIVTVRLAGAYPDFKQDDPEAEWWDDIYDHNTDQSDSIARWGCAMTAMANLLAYYGARDVDPGALNNWMINHNGYVVSGSNQGAVYWGSIDDYQPEGSDVGVIEYQRTITPGTSGINFQDTISDSLATYWPVIFEYSMPLSPSRVHYVVAVAITETVPGDQEYVIYDPLTTTDITRIDVGDARIRSARLYQPADGVDRPALTIFGLSPIAFQLTDDLGRRLGYDPLSNQFLQEIPEGVYHYSQPFWDPHAELGPSTVGDSLMLEIPGASTGSYELMLYGTGTGPYHVETIYRDAFGILGTSAVSGTVQMGTTVDYNVLAFGGWVTIQVERQLSLSVAPSSLSTGSTSTITLQYTDGFGNPLTNRLVTFSATDGAIPGSAYTDSNGRASVQYQSGNAAMTSRITAVVEGVTGFIDVAVVGPLYLPIISR
jgi:hypothetical protein